VSNVPEHQWLNCTGKYLSNVTNRIKVKIDYLNNTIKLEGTGSGNSQNGTEYDFTGFPSNYERGSLHLSVYPNGNNTFKLSNIKVTYHKVISELKDDNSGNDDTISESTTDDTTSEPTTNEGGGNGNDDDTNTSKVVNAEVMGGNTIVAFAEYNKRRCCCC